MATWSTAAELFTAQGRRQSQRHRRSREELIEAIESLADALAAAWGSLDDDRRRAIIAEALKRITVAPAGRGHRFNPERIRYAEPRAKQRSIRDRSTKGARP